MAQWSLAFPIDGCVLAPPRPRIVDAANLVGFDPATSVATERDEFTTTYQNADGTNTTAVSKAPLNVMVDDEWVEINTALTPAGDGTWEVEDNPLNPSFAKKADDGSVFVVERGSPDPRSRIVRVRTSTGGIYYIYR
jgi:hypothetical protein